MVLAHLHVPALSRYLLCANGEESNERFLELNDKVAVDEQQVKMLSLRALDE